MGWIAGVGVCPMKAKLPKPDLLQGSIKSIELLLWPNAMERDLAHKVARQSRKNASNEWPLHPKKLTFGEGTGRSAMCHWATSHLHFSRWKKSPPVTAKSKSPGRGRGAEDCDFLLSSGGCENRALLPRSRIVGALIARESASLLE